MIIYDDDGIGYDVVPRQAVKDVIAEIQTEIDDNVTIPEAIDFNAGLKFALDIIRKHTKVGN